MLAGTPARQGLDFNILLLETEEASATPHSGEKSAIKKNSKLGWLGHKLAAHPRIAATLVALGVVAGLAVRRRCA